MYKLTSRFGHFGKNEMMFPWEKCKVIAVGSVEEMKRSESRRKTNIRENGDGKEMK